MEYTIFGFLVEATRFELTTFASRTQRATNCATPRFSVFLNILYAHGNANIIPNTFPLVKPFFSNIASLSRIILFSPQTPPYFPQVYTPIFHFNAYLPPSNRQEATKKSLTPQKVQGLYFLLLKGLQAQRNTSRTKSLRQ